MLQQKLIVLNRFSCFDCTVPNVLKGMSQPPDGKLRDPYDAPVVLPIMFSGVAFLTL